MAKNIKVLIAEDHDVVREGLKILIGADPGIEIAGEADNGLAAVHLAKKLQPDVVLMDLAMPRGNGLEAAREMRRQVPGARILILSAYKDEDTVQEAIDTGVAGYMTKHSAADELLAAIHAVGQGNRYYSPAIASKLKSRRHTPIHKEGGGRPGSLTPRELEVLVLIAQGQLNKEIASTLGVSIKTIEKHRQATMDKLGIHDIAGLTRYALTKGLVSASERPAAQSLLNLR